MGTGKINQIKISNQNYPMKFTYNF